MNYKKILLVAFIGIFVTSSCDENLELINPNQLSAETFFKNETQLQSSVDATYAMLQARGLYARTYFFLYDNLSQENSPNPQLQVDKVQYLNYTMEPDHVALSNYWQGCYRGINKCNFVIENLENAEGVTDAVKRELGGEAYFLRALYYFMLVNRYGDIPLYTTLVNEALPRTSKNEVWDLIISDLTKAAVDLPAKGVNDLGRANSGAAYALLGKSQLFRGNYAAAKTALTQVMSGSYALEDNYFDNFMDETEHGVESIFEINFSELYGGSGAWGFNGTGVSEVNFRSMEYGIVWFNVYPSDWLLDEFEAGDPRFQDNFYVNGDILDPDGAAVVAEIPLGRRAAWKKYEQYYKQPASTNNSGINFKVIRYADVLLMMAEIENEIGSATEAIAYLNQVRSRPSTSMPLYGTPAMDNAGYPVGSKADIFEAIMHERIVEFPGEQVRFDDVLRWGLASQKYGSAGFITGKSELLPIPQNEIDNNPEINQENQNPGY
ncbi:MAG: RagB/SusD family nutrient uptake outer membrane protein [Flavobacteriaceae bacterium]|nr:RagB/SusD family nutrient uptake outer membrane protein [Flavobacteriaceae bacterium]